METRIVEIEGVDNLRDLGGLVTRQGEPLKKGRFYRGAALNHITPKGIETAGQLGICQVIDLRSTIEVQQAPDEFPKDSGIHVSHQPMLDHLQSSIAEGRFDFPKSMEEMYEGILTHYQPQFSQMFTLLADQQGGILYHCTAGKDRTGIASMLILGLADVEDDVIIEDYALSQVLASKQIKNHPSTPSFVFDALPQTMEYTLWWIRKHYGGIVEYLTLAGISPDKQQAIRLSLGLDS